jgi:hypothetical protein
MERYTQSDLDRMAIAAVDQRLVSLQITQGELRRIIDALDLMNCDRDAYLLRVLREAVRG